MRNEELMKKWAPILEHNALPAISDSHRAAVTATLLENTEASIAEGSSHGGSSLLSEAPANSMGTTSSGDNYETGNVKGYDPVLISLVRRAMPNLVAYDIVGVQPMTGPTGLIFAMKAKYGTQGGNEALYGEAVTGFAGTGTAADVTGDAVDANFVTGTGLATGDAEGLGHVANTADAVQTSPIAEMAFSIDKVAVTAKSRALKAEYSSELAQDLKAIHGLDAETELSNLLSAEILAEINREVVRTVYATASLGAASGTAAPGVFNLDVDANGRWSVEKFKGLMFQIEKEANAIAKATRRGKGNIIICSSDVASALQMAGVLDYTPALNNALNVDDTGNTFAGVLNGRFKVFVDPYAGGEYLVVGYKGSNAFDAGLFYCPYVPLQMVRAVGENSFQSKIGFKTRYGMVANPFATSAGDGVVTGAGAVDATNQNVYYRRVHVTNLL
jgi:hypothetical protein